MKFHRFIGGFDLSGRHMVIDEREVVHQLRDVLCLRVGEAVVFSNGRGMEARAVIIGYTKKGCNVEIQSIQKNENEPIVRVALYVSVLKKEKFEFVLQKATEVGVAEIIPVVARRTVKLAFNKKRAEKIIHEASEQSGRGIVPPIFEPMDFERAMHHARKNRVNIFFEPTAPRLMRKTYEASAGIFVGPEGGWDSLEVEAARKAGFSIASLCGLILRAETAAIVASYLAVSSK